MSLQRIIIKNRLKKPFAPRSELIERRDSKRLMSYGYGRYRKSPELNTLINHERNNTK